MSTTVGQSIPPGPASSSGSAPVVDRDWGRSGDPGFFRALWLLARVRLAIPRIKRLAYASRETICAERDRRLRRTVRWAYETTALWRKAMDERGVRPEQIQTLADLRLLPVVGDDEMRAYPGQFLSRHYRAEKCYTLNSGGTTGIRKVVHFDPAAFLWNLGYGEREKQVMQAFLGRGRVSNLQIVPQATSVKRFQAVYRRLIPHYRWHIAQRRPVDIKAPFEEKLEALNTLRPGLLSGFARALGEFFSEAKRRGVEVHRPKLVYMGAEAAIPEERRLIEEGFGIPTLMVYNSIEAHKMGYECEKRDGYHLHEDILGVRIVNADGNDVAPGESGRVVITNMLNRATMLINFDLGDEGSIEEGPCACGRTLRRLRLSYSRAIRPIPIPDGRKIFYGEVISYFSKHPDIRAIQILIERPDWWRIGVVSVRPEESRVWFEETARAISRDVTRGTVRVEVFAMERSETNAGGKVTPVVFRQPAA